MNSAPLEEKLKAFNFNVVTIDGHDYDQIEACLLYTSPAMQDCARRLFCLPPLAPPCAARR